MYYFGTDGIRAKAQWLIDNKLPYLLGKALSQYGGKVVVARDVRTHSLDIEKQLCKGLLEGSSQIWLTGVLPTPALAYIAQSQKADYAVMITASHNQPEFNGLKVFGKHGQKLPLSQEKELDESIHNLSSLQNTDFCYIDEQICTDTLQNEEQPGNLSISISPNNHRIRIVNGAVYHYQKHIKKMFPRFDGIKVHLDCANGCFAGIAPDVFSSLGAIVQVENNVQDGEKVNVNCGCTHIKDFSKKVAEDEIGFAFDGDGDRVLAVVNRRVYDGDAILLALSTLYRIQGKLRNKFVVGTTMTNTRLQRELAYHNTALLRAEVGDKFVLDTMLAQKCTLGGEKSGHILLLDRANTGDGLLTALSVLEVKKTVGSLPNYTPYPMLEFSIKAQNPKDFIATADFQQKMNAVQTKYEKKGRLIVRPSGTEPVVRVAFECFDFKPQPIFEDIKKMFE